MDRRVRRRRATDQIRTPAMHEAAVDAEMVDRVTRWLAGKGLLKVCAACGAQPLTAFGKNRRQPDGLAFYCRPCAQAAQQRKDAKRKATLQIVGGIGLKTSA